MIKAIFLATGILVVGASIAEAQQQRYNRGGYSQGYRGNNYYRNNGNRYVQNNFYGGRGYYGGNGWNNGGALAAGVGIGLLGGIIGSALVNQPAYAAPQPVYVTPPPPPVVITTPPCTRQYVTLSNGRTVLANICP